MENYERIIELLEKEILTSEEQNYLNGILHSDKEAARLVAVYNSLKTNIPNASHLNTEEIGDFILYKNDELPDDAIIPLLTDKIKSHLENCPICSEEYQILKKEYDEVGVLLEKTIKKEEKQYDPKSFSLESTIKKFSALKYAFATVAALAVIYFGLFVTSSIITPDYSESIFNVNDNSFYITRGRTSVTFQKGLDAAQKENFEDAINFFELDIKENSNESSIFYTHFITGLTYLKSAESSFLDMFKSFDEEKVNMAIENFNISIKKNTSGNYENLNLDAHYYLGRAYLLLENLEKAKMHLSIVIESKGKFYNNAKTLIEELGKN
jgi:tetratricopeptide (TPR) repeat protein